MKLVIGCKDLTWICEIEMPDWFNGTYSSKEIARHIKTAVFSAIADLHFPDKINALEKMNIEHTVKKAGLVGAKIMLCEESPESLQ